jgi:hypothetical protein
LLIAYCLLLILLAFPQLLCCGSVVLKKSDMASGFRGRSSGSLDAVRQCQEDRERFVSSDELRLESSHVPGASSSKFVLDSNAILGSFFSWR